MKKIFRTLLSICLVLVLSLFVACGDNPTIDPTPIDDPPQEEHVHELVHHEGKAPTCLDKGYEAYDTCKTCDYSTYKETEALGHEFELIEEINPTCTTKGYKKYKCTRCNEEKQEEIEALGHDLIHHEAENANCRHEGHSAYDSCNRCDYHTEIITTPKADHDFIVTTVDATLDSTGYVIKKCKICEEEIMEYSNPLNRSDEDLQDLNVLFIGNSLTNYNTMVKCFEYIAKAQGIRVNVTKVAFGAAYLCYFIEGKDGKYLSYVKDATRNTKFDVVFLQEQANPLIEPSQFYYSAREIKKYFDNLGTTCIFYQTWGCPSQYETLKIYGPTTEIMSMKIGALYEAIGDELGVRVSPAGTSFTYMYEKYKDQKDDLLFYASNNIHPSAIGTYIVALTHFATLYGRSVKGINYKYNDYAKQADITWHAPKAESIDDSMQNDIEEFVDKAVFGPSFVLDKYKTSSIGVEWDPDDVRGFKQTIEIDNANDNLSEINVTYKATSGKWKVGTDTFGTTSFINIEGESTLMFQEELVKDKHAWHTISYDIILKKALANSTFVRGIVFGSNNPNLKYFSRSDYDGTEALIIGRICWNDKLLFQAMRCWDGPKHGKISNYSFDGVDMTTVDQVITSLNRKYHIQIMFNLNEMKYGVYVDGKLSGIVTGIDFLNGGYIGIMAYDADCIQYSNFKFDDQRMILTESK